MTLQTKNNIAFYLTRAPRKKAERLQEATHLAQEALPTPVTHAISTLLKAGECIRDSI